MALGFHCFVLAFFVSVLMVTAEIQQKKLPEKPGPFVPPDEACSQPGQCDLSSVQPDVVLLKICEYEIRGFCLKHAVYDVVKCLYKHRNSDGMSRVCKEEIEVQRWILSPDFKQGPHRHPACAGDVARLCSGPEVRPGAKNGFEVYRAVAACLEKKQAEQRLSSDCSAYMVVYMQYGTLNYLQDAPFAYHCQNEIHRHCQAAVPRFGSDMRNGQVTECMKLKFLAHFVSDSGCQKQLVTSLQASHSDIRTDPLVYAACYRDLRERCWDVQPGGGRHMRCLLRVMEAGGKMELECTHLLRRRHAMWKFGAMVSPQSFKEFALRRRSTSFLFMYMNYIVAGCALLLTLVFAMFLVLLITKRRRLRNQQTVNYIRIKQATQDKSLLM